MPAPTCFLAFAFNPDYLKTLQKWCKKMIRENFPERYKEHLRVIPYQNLHMTLLYYKSLCKEEREQVWQKYIITDLDNIKQRKEKRGQANYWSILAS